MEDTIRTTPAEQTMTTGRREATAATTADPVTTVAQVIMATALEAVAIIPITIMGTIQVITTTATAGAMLKEDMAQTQTGEAEEVVAVVGDIIPQGTSTLICSL